MTHPLRGKTTYPIDTDRPQRYCKESQLSSVEVSLLYDIPRQLGGGQIVNVGHRNGGSAFVMALSLKDNGLPGSVLSMDVKSNPKWIADLNWHNKNELGDRVHFRLMTSRELGDVCRAAGSTFKFVFVDANHRYKAVLDDIKVWSPMVEVGGMIAFHDCISEEIHRAIKESLVGNPEWVERKDLHINKIRVFERESK
jgi:predicted O-methyltransferase YrrM